MGKFQCHVPLAAVTVLILMPFTASRTIQNEHAEIRLSAEKNAPSKQSVTDGWTTGDLEIRMQNTDFPEQMGNRRTYFASHYPHDRLRRQHGNYPDVNIQQVSKVWGLLEKSKYPREISRQKEGTQLVKKRVIRNTSENSNGTVSVMGMNVSGSLRRNSCAAGHYWSGRNQECRRSRINFNSAFSNVG